jgi:hypothetical protein
MHVEMCKYINIEGSLCKTIGVKSRWHAYMLREFKLMPLFGYYIFYKPWYLKTVVFTMSHKKY